MVYVALLLRAVLLTVESRRDPPKGHPFPERCFHQGFLTSYLKSCDGTALALSCLRLPHAASSGIVIFTVWGPCAGAVADKLSGRTGDYVESAAEKRYSPRQEEFQGALQHRSSGNLHGARGAETASSLLCHSALIQYSVHGGQNLHVAVQSYVGFSWRALPERAGAAI